MTNKLQTKILKIMIGDLKEDVEISKYEMVMKALASNYHVLDMCFYIAKLLGNLKERPNSSLQAFCINRAYEYLVYLNNAHELSHEVERLR